MSSLNYKKVTIGNATLYLGDCLELLASGLLDSADALVSDPPYGIGYVHGGGSGINAVSSIKPIHGDNQPFDPAPWLEAFHGTSEKNKAVVMFGADHFKTRLPEGGRFMVWDKSCGQGAAASFTGAEFMWTNRKNPRCIYRHFWMGATRSGEDNSNKSKRAHPSQKPIELMMWCIETARIGVGKTVLDPYMGSGSTGVAALRAGRKFIGVEIDEAYFEIACERLRKEAEFMGVAA